jgi:uncharacterized protein involved in outer membrane biogenesis
MFGLIRLLFSLIGFVVCLLIAVYFFRAHIVLGVVQSTLERSTGRQLIAATPRMSGWTPFVFTLDRAVLLNPAGFPKSEFLIFRGVEIKFRELSFNKGLDIERIVLDIEQMTIIKNLQGRINFQLPREGWDLISTMMADEVEVRIWNVFFYDFTASPNPVPAFYQLNHQSRHGPVKSHQEFVNTVLRPVRFIVENESSLNDE